MERRRRRSFSDDSALTKSAAWAWLDRRSGTEGRSKPEFDFSRKKSDGAPSRYKAEAMKKKVDESSKSKSNLSLLDRHDIERISRQLDYYIESGRSSRGGDGGRRAETKSKNGGKKAGKGMWLGSHAPLACGSSRGEVVGIMKSIEPMRRRRSSSENGRAAEAAEVVGRRPRQGIHA